MQNGLMAGRTYSAAESDKILAQASQQAARQIQRETVSSNLADLADVVERLWKAANFAAMHADAIAGQEPATDEGPVPIPAPQGIVEALGMRVGDLDRIASRLEYHQSRLARALG